MPLKYQTKTVTLSKGMRDDVDQFQLEPPHTALVKNGVFTKEGTISKRKGLETVASGAQAGTPLSVVEASSGTIVQGTEGLFYPSGGGYESVESFVDSTTIKPFSLSPASVSQKWYAFDVLGGVQIDTWAEFDTASRTKVVRRLKTADGGFFVSDSTVTDTLLSVACTIFGTSCVFTHVYQDGTDVYTNHTELSLDDGSSVSSGSDSFTAQINTSGDEGAALWIKFSDKDPYLFYQTTGGANEFRRYDVATSTIGSPTTLATGNLCGAYGDTQFLVALVRANATTLDYEKFSATTHASVHSGTFTLTNTDILRASYARDLSGTSQFIVATAYTETSIANGFDQWSQETNNTPNSVTSLQRSVVTQAFVDANGDESFLGTLFDSLYDEYLCTDVSVGGGKALFGTFPFVQRPFLPQKTLNTDDEVELPLMYKPGSVAVYSVDDNRNIQVSGTISTNKALPASFLETHTTNYLVPSVFTSDTFYFSGREVVSSPNSGVVYTGSAAPQDIVIHPAVEDKYATFQHGVYSVDLAASSKVIRTPPGVLVPGGSLGIYENNRLSLGGFTNNPEIASVHYDGHTWDNTATFPNGNLDGYITMGYDPGDILPFDDTQRHANIGIVVVLAATTHSGKKVRSAPSTTVYIPYVQAEGVDGYSVRDITLGLYVPGILPDNTKAEVYTFIATADQGNVTVGSAAKVGTFNLKTIAADRPTGLGVRHYVQISDPAGQVNDVMFTSEFDITTKGYVGGESLYSDTQLVADVIPPQNDLVPANNRVFFTDGAKLYYSVLMRTDRAPEFPASFFITLLRKDPLKIASLDDKVVLFYKNTISIVFGSGPNNLGEGSDFAQQELPGEIGLKDTKSVVSTPQGIMFRSARGFYLLDRGLVLKYLGGPQDILRGTTVVSAVNHEKTSSCIFSLSVDTVHAEDGDNYSTTSGRPPVPFYGNVASSGYALVYNYETGDWSVFTNYDFVAMEDVGSTFTGIRSDWTLLQEHDGYDDDDTTSNARENLLFIKSPWIKFTNMQDYAALRRVTCLFRYYSELFDDGSGDLDAGDVNVLMRHDYENDPNASAEVIEKWTPSEIEPSPERSQISFRSPRRKCQSVQLEIYETPTLSAGGTTYRVGRGFELSALDFQVGIKGGSSKLPAERKK